MVQNPQAFPNHHPERRHATGMSLRDYFAAKAMPAMEPSLSPEEIATKSYELADAMLKARGR